MVSQYGAPSAGFRRVSLSSLSHSSDIAGWWLGQVEDKSGAAQQVAAQVSVMENQVLPTDDPKSLIFEAFSMGSDFPGPAEDLLLSWMLSLDATVDPRAAAQRLVARHAVDSGKFENQHIRRLADLLAQTAATDPAVRGGRGRVAARRAASRGQVS
jgi:hypothetical protein